MLHFLEHAHNAQAPPPPPAQWQSSPHTLHRCYGCSTVCGKHGEDCMGTTHMSVCRSFAILVRYQGLQAPVVLASMVSSDPGILKDVVRANTLTSRAQSELHFFGPFFGWDVSPLTAGWFTGWRVMADQLRQGATQEQVQKVQLAGVLVQQPTLDKP